MEKAVSKDLTEIFQNSYLEFVATNFGNTPSREILYERCVAKVSSTDGQTKEPDAREICTSSNLLDSIDGTTLFPKSKVYDRKQGFMMWKRMDPANTIDEVSQLPLSHICFAFFDLMHELKDNCFHDSEGRQYCLGLKGIKSVNTLFREQFGENCPFISMSGSCAEHVDVSYAFVEKQSNDLLLPVDSEVIKNSDIDLMVVFSGYNVAFDNDGNSKIAAVVETENCRPGYLRLVAVPSSNSILEKVPSIYKRLNGKIYVTADVIRCFPIGFDIFDLFRSFKQLQQYNNVLCATKSDIKGPSWKVNLIRGLSSVHGSERVGRMYLVDECDFVYVFKCLTWPCVAGEWIHRKRQSGWPSQLTIAAIVSEGCHVVASAHDSSVDKDIEFRFSFSLAEVDLFSQMSHDQKQCYVTFKAFVTKCPYFLAQQNKNDNEKLKSYQLKTIFLWACETIPKDEWTTPSGLTRCFLFLIDQLLICLTTKSLPGYFIPEYNLFDTLPREQLEYFANVVHFIRLNPMNYAIQFLSTMFLYRDSKLVLEELGAFMKPIPAGTMNIERVAFIRELKFLQKLVISFDRIAIPHYWRKSNILHMFTNWCESKIQFVTHLRDFVCQQMSLFDVVYLDLVHDFQIPIEILSVFIEKEKSCNVRNKLVTAYCLESASNCFLSPSRKESIIQKACLLFETVIDFGSNNMLYGSYLVSVNKFGEAERILSTLVLDDAEFNIFNSASKTYPFHKQRTEIQELQLLTKQDNPIYLSSRVFANYLLIKCHIALQTPIDIDKSISEVRRLCASLELDKQYLSLLLLQQLCSDLGQEQLAQRTTSELFSSKIQLISKCDSPCEANIECFKGTLLYIQFIMTSVSLLLLDQKQCGPQSMPYKYLEVLISQFNALDLTKNIANSTAQDLDSSSTARTCPHVFNTLVFIGDLIFSPMKIYFLDKAVVFRKLAYTNFETIIKVGLQVLDRIKFSGSNMIKFVFLMMNTMWPISFWLLSYRLVEWLALKHSATPANKTYFAEFLLKFKNAQMAVPILEDVIKDESTSPVSVLIWPQELKTWLDDFIQMQMSKNGRDCLVLPTIVYACYLLSKIYYALGQSDDYERIMQHFNSSCETLGEDFPVSYSLLRYAYGLTGQDTAAGSLTPDQTTIVLDRKQILDQILDHRNVAALEIYRSFVDVFTSDILKIGSLSQHDNSKVLNGALAWLVEVRPTSECYACSFSQ